MQQRQQVLVSLLFLVGSTLACLPIRPPGGSATPTTKPPPLQNPPAPPPPKLRPPHIKEVWVPAPKPQGFSESAEECECEPRPECLKTCPSSESSTEARPARARARAAAIHVPPKTETTAPAAAAAPAPVATPSGASCAPPSGRAAFFIPKEAVADPTFGQAAPDPASCEPCGTGSQSFFSGIEGDFEQIGQHGKMGDAQIALGRFSCPIATDMCIEDTAGRHWRPTADTEISLIPVPKCHESGQCSVYMLYERTKLNGADAGSDDLISNGNPPMVIAEQDFKNGDAFLPLTEYAYVDVRGFSCSGCRFQYCSSHQLPPFFRHRDFHRHHHRRH